MPAKPGEEIDIYNMLIAVILQTTPKAMKQYSISIKKRRFFLFIRISPVCSVSCYTSPEVGHDGKTRENL